MIVWGHSRIRAPSHGDTHWVNLCAVPMGRCCFNARRDELLLIYHRAGCLTHSLFLDLLYRKETGISIQLLDTSTPSALLCPWGCSIPRVALQTFGTTSSHSQHCLAGGTASQASPACFCDAIHHHSPCPGIPVGAVGQGQQQGKPLALKECTNCC